MLLSRRDDISEVKLNVISICGRLRMGISSNRTFRATLDYRTYLRPPIDPPQFGPLFGLTPARFLPSDASSFGSDAAYFAPKAHAAPRSLEGSYRAHLRHSDT